MSIELVLSLYASIVATIYLYTRMRHFYLHKYYEAWIEKEQSTPPPPGIGEGSVVLPYEVEDRIDDEEDVEEREWREEDKWRRMHQNRG